VNYKMSWTEAAILAGSFAWFGMFFLIFRARAAGLLDRRDQGDAGAAMRKKAS